MTGVDGELLDPEASRAVIEQAKGALMLVYGLTAEQAFDVLRKRSQETNTKLRVLASRLVAELPEMSRSRAAVAFLRSRFDQLLQHEFLWVTSEARVR
ncbi:ANTAR domain-containing protein [Nocardia sp. XZ_19_385]|uniref:ANTAR domain-containing protein n=1 Tax=Nocardia sp. XZ_19_385 TaxID=2769488 RepID=UPI00188E5878